MTHGDKTKAKAGKKSQASAPKSQASQSGENGKTRPKAVAKSLKGGSKGSGEKVVRSSPKEAPAKGSGKAAAGKAGKGVAFKAAPSVKEPVGEASKARAGDGGFSNPAIASAFKHALKKYPNAFRKLTD